jgi:hypothetical protein
MFQPFKSRRHNREKVMSQIVPSPYIRILVGYLSVYQTKSDDLGNTSFVGYDCSPAYDLPDNEQGAALFSFSNPLVILIPHQ